MTPLVCGRFEVQRELGSGGTGTVVQALDTATGHTVAVKSLHRQDPASARRFRRELALVAGLEHPNLVRLGELFADGGRLYLTMELVEGHDLLAHVRPGGVLDLGRLRAALGGLAAGLAALHARRLVHRDVKPSNVRVTASGRVVLLDFGLARDIDGESSAHGGQEGTAPYMAPEQSAGGQVGPAADWYAVGVILFEALTGRPPFVGDARTVHTRKQVEVAARASSLARDVPPDLDALCAALLERDAYARADGEAVARCAQTPGPDAAAAVAVAAEPPAPFVGREAELRALGDALARARAGEPRSVLVVGESGLGKTSMVRRFVEDAARAEPRLLVLTGRCYERETTPFKAFDGIADGLALFLGGEAEVDVAALLPEDPGSLVRVFPQLRRVAAVVKAARTGRDGEAALAQEGRLRAFSAVRELLARIAARQPIVVVIDDLQWADADSRLLLREIMEPAAGPPLLLVLTARPGGTHAAPAGAEELALRPLSPAESVALASALGHGGGEPDGLAERIAREAGGHPMFIQELARHADAAPAGTAEVRLDEVLLRRVGRLDRRARATLEALVVAGTPVAVHTLARILDDVAAGVENAVARLQEERLVRGVLAGARRGVEPYHDRIRETVFAGLSDADRHRLHGAIAAALDEEGQHEPVVVVHHMVAAGRVERAAQLAVRGAQQASATLAFEQAAKLYALALELGVAPALPVLLARAQALVNAGRGLDAAEVYLEAAAASESMAGRLDCEQRAALQLLMTGHVERGVRHLRDVLANVGIALPTSSGRALAPLLWRRLRLGLRGLAYQERELDTLTPRDRLRLHLSRMAAPALSMVNPILGAEFLSGGLLFALSRGARDAIGHMLALDSVLSSTQGKTARAADALDRARAIADRTGDPYLWSWVHFADGFVRYFKGPFDAAVDAYALSEARMCEVLGTAFERTTIRVWLLASLRLAGDFPRLGEQYQAYLRDAILRGDIYARTTLERALNLVWLVKDEPAAARHALAETPWVAPEQGFQLQHWYELRSTGEIELYEGPEPGAAARFWQRFEAARASQFHRVQAIRAESLWLGARLALAERDTAGLPHADKLIRAMERERVAHCDVSAAVLRAGLAWRRARGGDAVEHLRRAVDLAARHHMLAHLAAARRRLGAIVAGDEGAGLVAAADAWMAASGVRNPARMTALLAPGFDAPVVA